MSVGNDEIVVRALHAPFWSEELQRGTKSAFQQTDISVSREKIVPYEDIVRIFKHDLDRPASDSKPARQVRGTASLRVDQVLTACEIEKTKRKVNFVEKPEAGSLEKEKNLSHALMTVRDNKDNPKKLPDAAAFAVLELATIKIVN
ncbi:hypothetical protein NF681_11560 [Comamonadaceae bacterium OTU4NAUVB1]|nr:hypothetical protein NF681_11560 [Comamonadaceae bacterium OTU4NAUVB1]